MSRKNRNRFESPLGVWTNQYTKPPEYLCLLNKLLQYVVSSLGFNSKLLHDWSNIDLPKLVPVPGGVLWIQVTGMIKGGKKIKTHKKSLDQNLTPKKSHAEFLSHKNLFAELYSWDM